MHRRKFLRLAVYGGLGPILVSYPVFIERNLVQINHYQVPINNLPKPFDGFKIAQLTDLHLGFMVSDSFTAGVIEKTNRLSADIIVCTGDFVHDRNTANEIDRVWPLLAKLNAKYGVYSVLGNHDHWADFERSQYWLNRTGQNLRHQCKPIYKGKDRIIIGGAGDFWEDELNIDKTFSCSDENDCRILLSHNPDSVDTKFNTPISLVLSGHTHGGQVVLPFYGPVKLPVMNKRYSSGLIETERTQLFISRGIGWAIYPVRFNCFPEIAVLELVNGNSTG